MQVTRRVVLVGATATAATAGTGALAQTAPWPTRPLKFVVPVAAGTATDLTARIFGDALAPLWGQPIVVENKPGADGLVALGSFVSGRDDHTLLFSFSTAVSLNPLIHAKLPYDPSVDLVPITTTSEVVFAIAVHKDVPAQSVQSLSDYAKADPGKLNWAAAPGLPRFVFERHKRDQGLDMAYVGYTQTGTAVQDLGEGRVQVMIASLNTLLPVVENGKVRILAMASTDRASAMATVPNAVEAGFPALAVPAIGCVYGWKEMPTTLRDRLARDIDTVAQRPDIVDRIGRIGQIIRRSTPAALAALLAEQRTSLAPLAAIMAQSN